jgi:hypothetical protein
LEYTREQNFFLEHAGELRTIVLVEEKGVIHTKIGESVGGTREYSLNRSPNKDIEIEFIEALGVALWLHRNSIPPSCVGAFNTRFLVQ